MCPAVAAAAQGNDGPTTTTTAPAPVTTTPGTTPGPSTTTPGTTPGPSTTTPGTTPGPSTTTVPGAGTSTTTVPGDPTHDPTHDHDHDHDHGEEAPNVVPDAEDPGAGLGDVNSDEDAPADLRVPSGPATGVPAAVGGRVGIATSLADAQALVAATTEELDAAEAALAAARGPLREANARLSQFEGEEAAAARSLAATTALLQSRAVRSYVAGGEQVGQNSLLNADGPLAAGEQLAYANAVAAADTELIEMFRTEQAAASTQVQAAARDAASATVVVDSARARVDEAALAVTDATVALSVAEEDADSFAVDGFTFPVQGPYTFVDSWGFCRDGCARSHKGNDVMAPWGNEIYATERGVIAKIGDVNLGGLRIWLYGASGTRYYYAHLAGVADGIEEGDTVELGEVIGFVGDTGNARGTPPHLHFEIHPAGRGAVDPFPLLRAAAQAQVNADYPLLFPDETAPVFPEAGPVIVRSKGLRIAPVPTEAELVVPHGGRPADSDIPKPEPDPGGGDEKKAGA